MAKASSEKKFVSFVKGLFTEANALTYPENASLDEDNFDLKLNGSRIRRQGIDYENGYTLTVTGIDAVTLAGTRKAFYKWEFPGGSPDVVLGVVRAYNKLWFMNMLATTPSTTLMNGGSPITISGLANSEIEISVITNFLVIVSEELEWPILLSYDASTDTVSQESYPLQVRDTWGVNDTFATDYRMAVSFGPQYDWHTYNLANQGWSTKIVSVSDPWPPFTSNTRAFKNTSGTWEYITGPSDGQEGGPTSSYYSPAIAYTYTVLGKLPSNSDVWTLGKVGSSTSADYEKYDPNVLIRNSISNIEAAKGSFIIDAYKRGYSRSLLTGFSLISDEELNRVSTVASYAGRIFYSGINSTVADGDSRSPNYSGFVFFSQVVTGKDKLGKCYQEADPTSDTISDLIDTDGGFIQFPEISKIVKLVAVKDSLLVFAENGVWEIYGDIGGFKATAYQVAKVSTTGITNGRAVVVADSSVVYWSTAGIFAVAPNPQTGRYETQPLSLTTIQTYYNSIPALAKENARGFYDEKENHIRWMYNDENTYTDGVNVNHYNRILNLDLALKAFYPFSISPLASNSPYISDFAEIPQRALASLVEDVYVSTDAVLVGTDSVQVPLHGTSTRDSKYSFLTFTGTSFTLSSFNNSSFVDWESADGTGVDFSSYLITGYDTFGELMRSKQTPYIFFYFNRTEDGFILSGGNLIATNQSSCLVQARWNWANSDVQGKLGAPFQAYRYPRNYVPSGVGDTFDTGDSIIVTKNKLRGSGKALSLKIYSEAGKDLQLLGWAYPITGDGTP